MTELIHADIFFFVTTIVAVVVDMLVAVALVYIVFILRDLRYLADLARKGGDKLAGDLGGLRAAAKEEGLKIKSIFDFFLGLFIRRGKRKSQKKNTE